MSLDIHIATSESEAIKQKPNLQFDLLIHSSIFAKNLNPKIVLFARLRDYYSDVKFEHKELGELINELAFLIEKSNEVKEKFFLERFLKLVEQAIDIGCEVYIFSD